MKFLLGMLFALALVSSATAQGIFLDHDEKGFFVEGGYASAANMSSWAADFGYTKDIVDLGLGFATARNGRDHNWLVAQLLTVNPIRASRAESPIYILFNESFVIGDLGPAILVGASVAYKLRFSKKVNCILAYNVDYVADPGRGGYSNGIANGFGLSLATRSSVVGWAITGGMTSSEDRHAGFISFGLTFLTGKKKSPSGIDRWD